MSRPDSDEQPRWHQGSALRLVLALAALAFVSYALRVLLVLFAGVLLGVFLDALSSAVARWTRIGRGAALTGVVALLLAAGAGAVALATPSILEQGSRMLEEVARVLHRVRGPEPQPAGVVGQIGEAAGPLLRSATAALDLVGILVVVGFLGLYLAARPDDYASGLVRLFPPRHRDRAREVLHRCARDLRRWMLGAGVAMVSAGVLTGLGLWLLGAPFPLALGLLAGVVELIPNVGPTAAAVLAVLFTLAQEGGPRWWQVLVVLVVIQTVQSYGIQPLTQRLLVELPPALTIGAVVLFGWLAGPIGVAVGIPLLIVGRVLVILLYWRDALGERVHLST